MSAALAQAGGGGMGSNGAAPAPAPAPRSVWLDAWSDPLAGAGALGAGCAATCNLRGDGDWHLVVADAAECKLKVWRGTARAGEHALPGRPTALAAYCLPPDAAPAPRLPVVAAAVGDAVYALRGLRPYFKFVVPALPAADEDLAVWKQHDAGTLGPADACAALTALRAGGAPLSSRSAALVAAAAAGGDAAALAYAAASRGEPVSRPASVTCLDTVKLADDDPDAPATLVVGTEDGRVLVLEPSGTGVREAAHVGGAPALLATAGCLAKASHRILAATRDGRLLALRAGGEATGPPVQLEAPAVGLARVGATTFVGVAGGAVHVYAGIGGSGSGRGGGGGSAPPARQYTLRMPAAVHAMAPLVTSAAGRPQAKCLLVALANSEVRVYRDLALVSVHAAPGGGGAPAAALLFGRYGREDGALVAVARGGALDVKILPRAANLDAPACAAGGPPPEQDVPLPVPAKTRLYVEGARREREGAADMLSLFQRGLAGARLETARALLKTMTDGKGAAAHAAAGATDGGGGAALSLSACVEGLGPRFRLALRLVNEGGAALGGLVVALGYDPLRYRADRQHLRAPLLVPLLEYRLQTDLQCLQPEADGGEVRLTVFAPGQGGGKGASSAAARPLVAALVRVPLSEPDVADIAGV